MHPIDKLVYISEAEKPLQYYPEFLINIDEIYINELDPKTKSLLKNKLLYVKKGYYKKIKKHIDKTNISA